MAQVARKHLDVALEFMGAIPQDPAVIVSARRLHRCGRRSAHSRSLTAILRARGAMLRWSAPQDDVSRLDTFMQRAIYGSRLQAAGAGA